MSWLYVKDQTQSPTFTYQAAAFQSAGANYVQQANDFGAQGNAYLGELAFSAPPTAAMQQAPFYFSAGSCTGFLCTTLNPLTQNRAGAAGATAARVPNRVPPVRHVRSRTHLSPPACRRLFACTRARTESTTRLARSDRSPGEIYTTKVSSSSKQSIKQIGRVLKG